MGSRGKPGRRGKPGKQGVTGARGLTGRTGLTGLRGPVGPPGVAARPHDVERIVEEQLESIQRVVALHIRRTDEIQAQLDALEAAVKELRQLVDTQSVVPGRKETSTD